jgi:phosphate uptake regulator
MRTTKELLALVEAAPDWHEEVDLRQTVGRDAWIAEVEAVGVLKDAEAEAVGVLKDAEAEAVGVLKDAEAEAVGVLKDAEAEAVGVLKDAEADAFAKLLGALDRPTLRHLIAQTDAARALSAEVAKLKAEIKAAHGTIDACAARAIEWPALADRISALDDMTDEIARKEERDAAQVIFSELRGSLRSLALAAGLPATATPAEVVARVGEMREAAVAVVRCVGYDLTTARAIDRLRAALASEAGR